MDGINERSILIATTEVCACLHGCSSRMHQIGGKLMTDGNIGNSAAVRNNVAAEVPVLSKLLLQEHGVGAGGRAIDGVVSAHDAVGLRVNDQRTEGR